jgi:SNF2 family DNA or RNA helicase
MELSAEQRNVIRNFMQSFPSDLPMKKALEALDAQSPSQVFKETPKAIQPSQLPQFAPREVFVGRAEKALDSTGNSKRRVQPTQLTGYSPNEAFAITQHTFHSASGRGAFVEPEFISHANINSDSELSQRTYRRQNKLFRKLQLGIPLFPEDRTYYGLDSSVTPTPEPSDQDDTSAPDLNMFDAYPDMPPYLAESDVADSDDEIFPLIDEWKLSDDESETFLNELEEEEDETEAEPEKMASSSKEISSGEHVRKIMAEEEESFRTLWREQKLPNWRAQSLKLWTSLRADPALSRRLLESTRSDLFNRQAKLEAALSNEDWSNENELRRVCSVLKQTVFQRLENDWRIHLLDLDEPPAAPATEKQPRPKPQPVLRNTEGDTDGDSDGIELDSESDGVPELDFGLGVEDGLGTVNPLDAKNEPTDDGTPASPWSPRTPAPLGSLASHTAPILPKDDPFDDDDFPDIDELLRNIRKVESVAQISLTHLPDSPDSIGDTYQSPIILSESEADELSVSLKQQLQPHKKRKREIGVSKKAKRQQDDAQSRYQEDRDRRAGYAKDSDANLDVVNPGKRDEEVFIHIDPHVSNRLQAHQLEGLQFMWREIVVGETGCLLSHTMGLGKTLQAIALLVTIAKASISSLAVKQIPERLRSSWTLILCPPALASNWLDELKKWAPPDIEPVIGPKYFISSDVVEKKRLGLINHWATHGGLLLIGYELFAKYVNAKDGGSDLKQISKHLTKLPNLIIVDEAHKLKSPTSQASVAASKLESPFRVALTGSPMSNTLEEYYAMIDFVSPGYLGKREEFRSRFEEPINEGGYLESTTYEKRQALVRAKALLKVLQPKIDRKDVSILQGMLPKKVELVIKVRLRPFQRILYEKLLDLLGGPKSGKGTWSILAYGNLFTLICNHPTIFRRRLEDAKKKGLKDSTVAENTLLSSPGMLKQLLSLYDDGRKRREWTMNEQLSHKMNVLMIIIWTATGLNEKTLVFSQSIATLDYIGDLLKHNKISFARLDGNSATGQRQSMIDEFNNGSQTGVFLISTKAGSTGHNLHSASRVVLFDFGFNPTWEEQAIGRAYRIGQTKPVWVYRLVCDGTYETQLENITTFKTQLAFKILEDRNTTHAASKSRASLTAPEYLQGYAKRFLPLKKFDPVLCSIVMENCRSAFITKILQTDVYKKEISYELTEEEAREVETLVEQERSGKRSKTK